MSSKVISAALASAVATAVVMGAVHVLHAEAPSFAPGEALSSSKMNASFLALSNRIDALEKSTSVPAVPAGTIVAFGGPSVPEGWLLCDGAELDRVAEPTLFAAVGTSWGAPSATKFNLPDLRGRFLRGVDGEAKRDPDADGRVVNAPGGNRGNVVGSVQGQELLGHAHNTTSYGASFAFVQSGPSAIAVPSGQQTFGSTNVGGSETRPKNANVVYIIKR